MIPRNLPHLLRRERGVAGGLASLDSAGLVPESQLPYSALNQNLLTTGEETMPRANVLSSATQTSGLIRFTYFTARKSGSTTGLRVVTAGTAAGATPTLIRYGLWTVADDGDLTLVASTANDTALLASISTQYPKAFSSPYVRTAGVRYAVGVLVVTGATAPVLCGYAPALNTELNEAPRISASLTGQTDLPASVDSGSLGTAASFPYVALY